MTRKEELELDLLYYKNKVVDTTEVIRKYEALVNFNLENLDNSRENLKDYKNLVKQIREKIKECAENDKNK